jgi:peptidoglycan/LPS O-acetylase OafA/YrhL
MKESRQREIDSLRGLAVLLVVFDHFGIHRYYGFPVGIIGVKLLFLFSGYFITKQVVRAGQTGGIARNLGDFYARRVFRLLPVLWGAVAVGCLLNLDGARAFWAWHLSFATNFLIMGTGEWPGAFSHFWSLGLQMQFYAIWPLVFLAVPQRHWGRALVFCFATGLAFRAACLVFGVNEFVRWFHLPASLDAFAAGACISWLELEKKHWLEPLKKWHLVFTPLAVGALVGAVVFRMRLPLSPWTALRETLECLFLLWFVLSIRLHVNPLSFLLRNRALEFTGLVSFGLYAFHPLVENALSKWVMPGLKTAGAPVLLCESLLVVICIGAAAACYRWIELPSPRLLEMPSRWIVRSFEQLTRLLRMTGLRSSAWACAVIVAVMVGMPKHYFSTMTSAPAAVEETPLIAQAAPPEPDRDPIELTPPEFDWPYAPFGNGFDNAPVRDVEVSLAEDLEEEA